MSKLIVILLCLIPAVTQGKCESEYHVFSGKILERDTPISDTKISVQFQDGMGEVVRFSDTTSNSGEFSIKVRYSTHSRYGLFSGHKCKFSPKSIRLNIHREGKKKFSEQVALSNESTTYNKNFE